MEDLIPSFFDHLGEVWVLLSYDLFIVELLHLRSMGVTNKDVRNKREKKKVRWILLKVVI
jgi:hypothetical protein